MILSSFDEANAVLEKPSDMTHEQCEAASCFRGVRPDGLPVVITCWKLTREELEEITRTGRVWLHIIGDTMPPACVDGFNPF